MGPRPMTTQQPTGMQGATAWRWVNVLLRKPIGTMGFSIVSLYGYVKS